MTLLQRTQRNSSELQNAGADRRVPKPFRVKFVNSARHLDPDVDDFGRLQYQMLRHCRHADHEPAGKLARRKFPIQRHLDDGPALGVRESDNGPGWKPGRTMHESRATLRSLSR